jgi:Uma2 family endonuclease
MSTTALIPEEAYLRTVYEPDCEYDDGVVVERNVGEPDHSWFQAALAAYFFSRRKTWGIEVFTEVRHKLRSGRYMLPDVCVIYAPRPAGKVFTKPPVVWIEILSPEDRPMRVNKKIRELLEFGAGNIWIIDPETLEAELHTVEGSTPVADGVLRGPGTPIEVLLNSLEND